MPYTYSVKPEESCSELRLHLVQSVTSMAAKMKVCGCVYVFRDQIIATVTRRIVRDQVVFQPLKVDERFCKGLDLTHLYAFCGYPLMNEEKVS